MASGKNVVWMRQRWASRESDPGRSARQQPARGSDQEGGQSVAAAIKREFLRRPVVIDCPRPGCVGLLLPGRREVSRPGGTRVRIVLRCTREPEDHDFVISMDPYTGDEVEQLTTSLRRGEGLICPRCGAPMQYGVLTEDDGWGKPVDIGEGHYCAWCGVIWSPPEEAQERASERRPESSG